MLGAGRMVSVTFRSLLALKSEPTAWKGGVGVGVRHTVCSGLVARVRLCTLEVSRPPGVSCVCLKVELQRTHDG